MGSFRLRFNRRVRIAPGVRLNFSKSGVSTSLGGRGLWYTLSRNGRRRTTVGLPGTGLYMTRVSRAGTRAGGAPAPGGAPRSGGARALRWVLIAFAAYVVIALLVVLVGGAFLAHH
jgi:hypothetical protein